MNWLDEAESNLDQFDTSLLTPVSRRLIAVIGLRDTVSLLAARGGTIFRFPKFSKNAVVLKDYMSESSVIALCNSDFAGEQIDLPKIDVVVKFFRNQQIKREHKESSTSFQQLALKYNLSRKWVEKICNEGEESPNLELF